MRIRQSTLFTLIAIVVATVMTSGCAVYAPAPRGYVVAPVPVVVAPSWGFHGGRHW